MPNPLGGDDVVGLVVELVFPGEIILIIKQMVAMRCACWLCAEPRVDPEPRGSKPSEACEVSFPAAGKPGPGWFGGTPG